MFCCRSFRHVPTQSRQEVGMPTSVPGGSFWQSDAASATDSLMHPPLALAGVSTGVQRRCQHFKHLCQHLKQHRWWYSMPTATALPTAARTFGIHSTCTVAMHVRKAQLECTVGMHSWNAQLNRPHPHAATACNQQHAAAAEHQHQQRTIWAHRKHAHAVRVPSWPSTPSAQPKR